MVKILNGKYPIIDYVAIAIGSALMAIGINILVDAQVVQGGVSGLAMAIHYLSGNTLPIGLIIVNLKCSIILWGFKDSQSFQLRTFLWFYIKLNLYNLRGHIPLNR